MISESTEDKISCPKCGHKWSPRVEQPKRCPRCGRWLVPAGEGEEEKQKRSKIQKVEKRDGRVVDFDQSKITKAIWSAAQSVGGRNKRLAKRLSDKVVDYLERNISEEAPHVEEIQDAVEKVLIENGHAKTAKAYILYRKQHEDMRKIKSTFLEVEELVDDYLGQRSWRVKENSNIGYSMSGLYKHAAGSVVSNYTLDRIYPMEVSDAHRDGDIHIHDLAFGIAGYCFDEETRILTEDGLKYFDKLNGKEKIATLDPETKELVFQKPEKYQVYEFEGKLLHFSTDSINLLVTPEHKLLHMTNDGSIKKIAASEVGKKSVVRPPKGVCSWNGENREVGLEKVKNIGGGPAVNLPDTSVEKLAEFIGWYIAEGNVDMDGGDYRISISQVNKANQQEVAEVMEEIGLNPSISEYHVASHSKQLYEFLKKLGISNEKSIPKEFKNADTETIESMLKTLFRGDGTFDEKGRFKEFYSNSKKLVEDVAECLIKTGRWASIRKRRDKYELTVSRSEKFWYEGTPDQKEYDGKVYDVTVPNGTVLVEKEGKFMWSSNCAGWSLSKLLKEGFNGVPGRVESKPPKHYDTALLQMANFIGTLQNEWAGAQAFNSMDTLLAPFVRKDGLSYEEVKQGMQKFVFNLNIASRWGGQTPFTNLTLDWMVPEDLKESPIIHAGETKNETYTEYQEEMNLINRALLEVLMEGDKNGRPFTFPIPTYNVTDTFNWDSENAELLFEMTARYGLPYFSNFINSPDMDPDDIRSMCCRLRLDERELERNITGGLFGSSDMTGSLGVVTVNMPRIGFLSENESEFFERLSHMMVLAKNSLEVKREVVNKNMQNDLLPYSKRYLGHLENHFSTIGLVGMNEACLNLFGKNIATQEGHDFSVKVLEFMRGRLQDFQEKTGNLYNLEATPAEGTSYRLARIDKKKYPEIVTAGEDTPYYTNSTQVPVDETDDVFEQIEIEEDLQNLYTGGTVFHTFLGEKMTAKEARMLIKKLTHESELPYITLTPTYSICPDHGYIIGEHPECPECGKPTEVYSRVVGYYRPVQNWNDGKREEFNKRENFKKSKAAA